MIHILLLLLLLMVMFLTWWFRRLWSSPTQTQCRREEWNRAGSLTYPTFARKLLRGSSGANPSMDKMSTRRMHSCVMWIFLLVYGSSSAVQIQGLGPRPIAMMMMMMFIRVTFLTAAHLVCRRMMGCWIVLDASVVGVAHCNVDVWRWIPIIVRVDESMCVRICSRPAAERRCIFSCYWWWWHDW